MHVTFRENNENRPIPTYWPIESAAQCSPFICGPERLQRDTLGVDDVWWYIHVALVVTLTRRFHEQVNALKIIR
tara:strand:+ start:231 stop:452 length:222 start_codon:yes stop_codon:yes gene_type:complete